MHKPFLTLAQNGTLRDSIVPGPVQMDNLWLHNLLVLSTPHNPIIVNSAWDNKRLNEEIKNIFPQAISYLENLPDAPTQVWVGVIRHKQTLWASGGDSPTSVQLIDQGTRPGLVAWDRVLFIASKARIPIRRSNNWEAPESELKSEDLRSDIGTIPSEDIIMTPTKPDSEPESNMKQAAKKRETHLATGSIKRKTLFLPASSEGEDELADNNGDVIDVDDLPDLLVDLPINKEFPEFLSQLPQRLSAIADRTLTPEHQGESSPERDPPVFFGDYDYFNTPSPPPASTTASTSSLPVASGSNVGLDVSTTPFLSPWALPSWVTSVHPLPTSTYGPIVAPPLPPPYTIEPGDTTSSTPSTSSISLDASRQPHLRKMGAGRAGRNPWAAK
ncbi:hypothetical protein C8J57DRAFT_1211382 [Mycena rebaudengoi]|nr:hypothetical protein C8J57DRAFT_1211382 [Mycena rebaudengoi]